MKKLLFALLTLPISLCAMENESDFEFKTVAQAGGYTLQQEIDMPNCFKFFKDNDQDNVREYTFAIDKGFTPKSISINKDYSTIVIKATAEDQEKIYIFCPDPDQDFNLQPEVTGDLSSNNYQEFLNNQKETLKQANITFNLESIFSTAWRKIRWMPRKHLYSAAAVPALAVYTALVIFAYDWYQNKKAQEKKELENKDTETETKVI